MVLDSDLVGLLLYCVQQLGIVLGVGAQSIMLIAYLVSLRDGVIDSKEAQFARAVRKVLLFGIALIVASGIGAVLFEIVVGKAEVISEPAFLFKWILIIAVSAFALFLDRGKLSHPWVEGVVGGTWYALFLLHILAPVTNWIQLTELFVVWLVGFSLCWVGLVYMIKGKSESVQSQPLIKKAAVQSAPVAPPQPKAIHVPVPPPPVPKAPVIAATPAPVPTPPVPKAPVVVAAVPKAPAPTPAVVPANLPVLKVAELPKVAPIVTPVPTPPVPQRPVPQKSELEKAAAIQQKIEDPDSNLDLPAVRVMPRTPDDLLKQNRGAVVQLNTSAA
jgi:hypothetical protein